MVGEGIVKKTDGDVDEMVDAGEDKVQRGEVEEGDLMMKMGWMATEAHYYEEGVAVQMMMLTDEAYREEEGEWELMKNQLLFGFCWMLKGKG
mmetsp:Transcript_16282/g.26062  ORF Transcript_16282/g.26062 Transcript_16282/m.26062 type:complete len:92 (+) Transcript_16282:387-662(+)